VHSKSTGSVLASLIGKEGLGDWKHAIERIREDDYVIRINFKPRAANHLCPGRLPPYYAPGLDVLSQIQTPIRARSRKLHIEMFGVSVSQENTSSIQAS
jgi:hypothetical protein